MTDDGDNDLEQLEQEMDMLKPPSNPVMHSYIEDPRPEGIGTNARVVAERRASADHCAD